MSTTDGEQQRQQRLDTLFVIVYEDEHGIENEYHAHPSNLDAAFSEKDELEGRDEDGPGYWPGEFRVDEYQRVQKGVGEGET